MDGHRGSVRAACGARVCGSDAVLKYDPNSNVSLAVTPGGFVVRVMFISGFIFVFDYSQSIL